MRFCYRGIRIVGVAIGVYLFIFLSSCSSTYEFRLKEKRQENLEKDLLALKQNREAIIFPTPLSLDDVIKIGLTHNLDMRISRLLVEISDDTALAKKLTMLPTLNMSGELSHRSNYPLREYENLETGDITLSNTVSEEKTRQTLSAVLSWNLLDFGLSYIRARQAAYDLEVKQMEQLRQSQTLALDIAAAYWKSVLAERNLKRIREIEDKVSKYRDRADEMVVQKRMDPIVAKDFQKHLASLAITAGGLQAEISGMRIELCRLMGISPLSRFELAEDENFKGFLKEIPAPRKLEPEDLELTSLKNRPELFASDLRYEIQREEARAALISMFPGIRFDAGYYYDDNKYLVNNDWTDVGVGLVMNLLDLPSQYMMWKSRDKELTMAEAQRLVLSAGIIAQVHMAIHDYRVKEEQFRLYDDAFTVSEELLKMSAERNQAGSVGFTDTVLTRRMMETMVAQLERDKSVVELLNAYATLMVTMGLDYDEWDKNVLKLEDGSDMQRDLSEDISIGSFDFSYTIKDSEFSKAEQSMALCQFEAFDFIDIDHQF